MGARADPGIRQSGVPNGAQRPHQPPAALDQVPRFVLPYRIPWLPLWRVWI